MEKRRRIDDALLPVSDLIQILVWLPVLSLLRFKSVCKSWRDLIQSSSFIDLHTANTFNSNDKFGSFILLARAERRWPAASRHKQYALLMLSSSSSSSSTTDESGSSTGSSSSSSTDDESGSSTGLWWSSTDSNYDTDYYAEWEEEHPDDYDDQVFTVDNYYYYNRGGGGSTSNEDDKVFFKLETLGFPSCYKFRHNYCVAEIVGSYNGLVCLYDREGETKDVSLWNPATRQFRLLPKSITIDEPYPDPLVAFGLDVQTKDYKVLLLNCFSARYYRTTSPVECLCRAQVYSLSTNSWRLLEGINFLPGYPQHSAMDDGCVLYLNGSCFFIAKFFCSKLQKCFPENNRFIIAFDFTKEIFTPMHLPDHHLDQELYLSSLGDKIAIFTGGYYAKDAADGTDIWIRGEEDHSDFFPGISKFFDIWVLNEHSSNYNNNICSSSSWTKLYSFRIELEAPYDQIIPRGISNDGEFVMIETKYTTEVGKKMKLYNLVTKEVKKNFLACSMVRSKANAYKPSLVDLSST